MAIPQNLLSFFLIFTSFSSVAQNLKKEEKLIVTNLQAHVTFLADDKLEGRRAGTDGERQAGAYIRLQFQKAGLEAKGDNGSFFQPFNIWEGRNFESNSSLHINGEEIKPGEYYPLPCSPKINLESSPSIALKEAGVPWFLDIKEDMASAKNNPHFNLFVYLTDKAKSIAKKGATVLFVYNTDSGAEEGQYDPKQRMDSSVIPIVMINHRVAKKFFSDETATLIINLKILFQDNVRTGNNVIGFINNNASNTVCIGAHYDHLGYGEDGGSLLRTGEHLVHNGADDNASGVAALIELARLLKQSKYKSNNYLFVAFSGEELGLFGSKYFTEHPTIDLSQTNYMINMDMVGRLNENKTVTIGGYGTSPAWPSVFNSLAKNKNLVLKFDSSGSGPSDHTSFYRKNIPVLFFFTGIHSDYHRPGDDANKINYTGESYVVQLVFKTIELLNKQPRLAFTPTRDQQSGTTASFSVTLGIMPDYAFNGVGVRIDGVSDGRPAQKSGLLTGDIIVKLGVYPVSSLEDYMQALGKFKKGDNTKVTVKRAKEVVETDVAF